MAWDVSRHRRLRPLIEAAVNLGKFFHSKINSAGRIVLDQEDPAKQRKAIAQEKTYYEVLKSFSNKDVAHHLLELTANLNSKTSALLTHVSIMIAASTALALLPVRSRHDYMKGVLFVEVIVYVSIAAVLLLAVDITTPDTFSNLSIQPIEKMMLVVRRRRLIFRSTLYSTIVLTVVLAISIAVKFVLIR